jgi:hypothetical protein
VIGWQRVGYSEQMMVAPANVAPGLAACACADRPASYSEIFHRRTEPRQGLRPLSAPILRILRVQAPGAGYQVERGTSAVRGRAVASRACQCAFQHDAATQP